jgi:hypothetical protein
MPEIDFEGSGWVPNAKYADIIDKANTICQEYVQQGYDLTLRQLYYQFVARDLLANTVKNYDLLGRVLNQARWCGYFDWDYLVDRTRNVQGVAHWNTPAEIIKAAASSFRLDKWAEAEHVVEIWVEKEALAGIIAQAGTGVDCRWFPCRGYVSASEIYQAGLRLVEHIQSGQEVTILHLGDLDPSGLQMTDDNYGRLLKVVRYYTDASKLHFKRIALNMPQIAQYNPPENPAKEGDSRYAAFVAYTGGTTSWELDALPPPVLVGLITQEVEALRDEDVWRQASDEEKRHRETLDALSERWNDVSAWIEAQEDGNANA